MPLDCGSTSVSTICTAMPASTRRAAALQHLHSRPAAASGCAAETMKRAAVCSGLSTVPDAASGSGGGATAAPRAQQAASSAAARPSQRTRCTRAATAAARRSCCCSSSRVTPGAISTTFRPCGVTSSTARSVMMRSTTPTPVSGSVHLGRIFRSKPPSFFLRHVLHQHDHALHAGHQVHRAAHALDHLAGDHPVGQVALLADLHRAQDGQVDLAAADHARSCRGCRRCWCRAAWSRSACRR